LSIIEELEQLHEQTGWGLIPLIGKRPIEKDWQRWCEAKRPFNKDDFRNGKNAGIPCGPANQILVIDVDDVEKFNFWLDEKKFELPVTRVHMTGSGKPHYIYQYPTDGQTYGNRSFKDPGGEIDPVTGKVKSIFDIRGLGGQIVSPGSVHPATQKEYTVRHDIDIAPAPGWLLKLAIQDTTPEPAEAIEGAKNGLEELNLPYPIKRLIEQGETNGRRSEAIMSVLNSLVKANVSNTDILSIFEAYPIGEKFREKGHSKEQWLLDQIKKVRGSRTDTNNEGLTARLKSWVDQAPGSFSIRDIKDELRILDEKGINLLYVALHRLEKDHVVEKEGSRRGYYRRVENDLHVMDFLHTGGAGLIYGCRLGFIN
jgi:hypothetical protein